MVLWINNKNHLNKIGDDQDLADTFYDVCVLSTQPKNKNAYNTYEVIDCRINKFTGYDAREVDDVELCKKLVELKDKIKHSLDVQYKKGKKDGQNLLIQLNKGEITLKDIEF